MFKKTFLSLCFIATLVGLALGYENKENPGALKDRENFMSKYLLF